MTETDSLIVPIVEGHGEVQAVPVLIRRICSELMGRYDVAVRKPWKLPRGKIVKSQELARAVQVASQSVGASGGIIVILDQDDDPCVVDLAQSLNAKNSQCRLEVVVASREYEAWFLAAVGSLRGHKSVVDEAQYFGDPETPRDAKGKLEEVMVEKYRETLHQASFTDILDLNVASASSRSFRRMISAVRSLLD